MVEKESNRSLKAMRAIEQIIESDDSNTEVSLKISSVICEWKNYSYYKENGLLQFLS